MEIKSGVLKVNKTEKKGLEEMIKHSLIDMSFREQGTFNKAKDGEFDEKATIRVKRAISDLNWILENF